MSARPQALWMIRAGEKGRAIEQFLAAGRIAIGGAEPGIDYLTFDHTALTAGFARAQPEKPLSTLSNWARQDIEFRDQMAPGDIALTWRPGTRSYLAGEITGPAAFDPGFIRDHRPWGLLRPVRWQSHVPRDALPPECHAALDRRCTLHRVASPAAPIILRALRPLPPT